MLVLKSISITCTLEEQKTVIRLVQDFIKKQGRNFNLLSCSGVEESLIDIIRGYKDIKLCSCVSNLVNEHFKCSFIPENCKDIIKKPVSEDGIRFDKNGLTIDKGCTAEEIVVFFKDVDASVIDDVSYVVFLVKIDTKFRDMSSMKIRKIPPINLDLCDMFQEYDMIKA